MYKRCLMHSHIWMRYTSTHWPLDNWIFFNFIHFYVVSYVCVWNWSDAIDTIASDQFHTENAIRQTFYLHIQNKIACTCIFYYLQYIPRNMHTVFALLCFVVVIHWLIFPYPSGLLHWHCGNLTIAPVPSKQPWWIWINTSCEFVTNDCVTATKQSTTRPCAYFLGYTVFCCHTGIATHRMVFFVFSIGLLRSITHTSSISSIGAPRPLYQVTMYNMPMDHPGYELSQSKTTLRCNVVSRWLNDPEWSLIPNYFTWINCDLLTNRTLI